MFLSTKKASVIGLVTILLLLFLTVGVTFQVGNWYTQYREDIVSDETEELLVENLEVIKVDGSNIYLNNQFRDGVPINSILIGGQNCSIAGNVTVDMGLSIIDIGECAYHLAELGTYDVAIISDLGIVNEYEVIRNIGRNELFVSFQTSICDISSGYVRLYGLNFLNNSHAERGSSSSYTYNVCIRHLTHTLGVLDSGLHQVLFSLTEDTNSMGWINRSSIYESPSQWINVSVSSSGGTFFYGFGTQPNSSYRCVGSMDLDDVYGSHMGDCVVGGSDKIWLYLS